MADSTIITSPEGSWLGIKLAYAVAGFWGGVVSLSFVKNLTPVQGVLAVITGVVSAGYATPLITQYLLSEPSSAKEHAVAYVIGLTAMNLIPGLIKLSELWRNNPWMFVKGGSDESKHE